MPVRLNIDFASVAGLVAEMPPWYRGAFAVGVVELVTAGALAIIFVSTSQPAEGEQVERFFRYSIVAGFWISLASAIVIFKVLAVYAWIRRNARGGISTT